MRLSRAALLLPVFTARSIRAHDGHGVAADDANYAQRHMAEEHHISDFDLESFFHLHDLDRDGLLSINELEQIYGLHHETSRGQSESNEHHDEKSKEVLEKVLARLDKNRDGIVTKREFVEGGIDGLPDFKNIQGLGHHYDTEGEYFLHHEELYHNTPATQTEESYTHPEDIEHFRNHEAIELEEENKVRHAQGLPLLDEHGEEIPGSNEPHQEQDQQIFDSGSAVRSAQVGSEELLRQARADEAHGQADRFAKAREEAGRRGDWGLTGDEFRRPKDVADRLRKSVPYKYRVKTNWWGEF